MTAKPSRARKTRANSGDVPAGNPPGGDAARGGWVLDEARDLDRIGLRPPSEPATNSLSPTERAGGPPSNHVFDDRLLAGNAIFELSDEALLEGGSRPAEDRQSKVTDPASRRPTTKKRHTAA